MSAEQMGKALFPLVRSGQTPVRVELPMVHPVTGEIVTLVLEGAPIPLHELNHMDTFYQSDPFAEDGRAELDARRRRLMKVIDRIEGIEGFEATDAKTILSNPGADDLCFIAWPVWRAALLTGHGFRSALEARKPQPDRAGDVRVSTGREQARPDTSVSDVSPPGAAAGADPG